MPDVTITLTNDEALVLFEFLVRFKETNLLGTEDQAEQRALWNLHCLLEGEITAPFAPNYHELLVAARDALRDDGGTNCRRPEFWADR